MKGRKQYYFKNTAFVGLNRVVISIQMLSNKTQSIILKYIKYEKPNIHL